MDLLHSYSSKRVYIHAACLCYIRLSLSGIIFSLDIDLSIPETKSSDFNLC